MSKKGVSKISGNPSPKVGEAVTYTVTDWYPSTPQNQRNPANVTWELFKKRSNGRFTSTNIKKTGLGNFTFGEVAQKHTYRLEAYLFEPEGRGASTIEINPQPAAVPKIEKVELQYVDDSPGTVFSFTEKMRARAQCVNLNGEKLKFTLWEDDVTGEGHDAKNLLIETKEATVDRSGVATAEFILTRALMQKAMQGETDPKQLEFYVTVEYFSHKKHATDNVNVNNPLHTSAPTPQPRPQQPTNNAPTPPESTPETPSNNTQPRAENSPAAEKPASQMEERGVAGQNPNPSEGELHDYQEAQGTIEAEQPSTPQANEGKTVSIVEDSSVEELLDAYFAKKEYTKQTGEAAGTLEYQFGSNGNKTATDAEKEKIAKIILGKPAVKALADKKEYTTLEAIKQALSKEVYNKDEKISFQTFKLGAELKKITSAPLDTKLYLVAKTAGSGLSDKQATIIIKEKDGLIKGSAGVVLPILEISEEQMDQATPTTGEVPGTEKSEFTGKIENGMVKIPVHLRPKSDDELKQWKEKVSRGKEDGEYTYKFGGENKVTDENSKKRVAEAILKNAKNGNTNNEKITDGKTAYIDDIEKALEIKTYQKDQTIKFKLYKKEKELLYLQAKAQGEKQHDKEFLKADGAYFEVGSKCPRCEAEITLKDIENSFDVYSNQKDFRQKIVDSLNKFIKQRKNEGKDLHLNTCLRKAHFFAQVGVETLGIHGDWIIEGKINHSVESAKSAFGDRARTLERNGLLSTYCLDRPQTRLYNYLYALGNGYDNGNGNEASGDGWKFRGRGLKQITGRGNYKMISEVIKEIFPVEYNALPQANAGEEKLVSHPEKVEEIDYAVITAIAYWEKHKIWELADTITSKTSSDNDFKKIRQKVVGESGFKWKAAKDYFKKTYDAFRVGECQQDESSEACTPDSSQCFNYADVWENPEISSDNGGKNNNRYGSTRGHKGIDILSGSTYKDVHSIMCGTVEKIVTSFKTNQYGSLKLGNVVNVKSKDKNGNTVYILYCHLDEVYVTEGQKVKHGEKIALSGSTGNASDGSLPNGVPGRGIKKENWHVHIEACANGAGLVTFFGKDRLQPEDYMKTKFDTNGNAIK